MVNHAPPWSNMALWQRLSWYENKPWLSMVNHGAMLRCENDYLNVKINHGQTFLF